MSQQLAYTGFWVDRTRDYVLGATLTMKSSNGAYIIAALSSLVTIAGASAWTLLAFTLHQVRATDEPHDAAFYQHQVVFRNAGSALGSVWTLYKTARAWKNSSKLRNRTRVLLLCPLLTYAVFEAASILQARIATKAYNVNLVKLRNQNCGFVDQIDGTIATAAQLGGKKANDTRAARTYAGQCYNQNIGALGCTLMPVQYLNYTTNVDTACPFKPATRCSTGINGAVSFDTGYINSHRELGINARNDKRLEIRIVRTCSVLHTGDLVTETTDASTVADLFLSYSLGYSTAIGDNTTFLYSTKTATSQVPYEMFSVYSYATVDNGLELYTDFNRTDADVSFHFFAPNAALYSEAVYDPFFSANGTFTETVNGILYYQPDVFVHLMGCADQYQFREPISNRTTSLTGLQIAKQLALELGLNSDQVATLTRLTFSLQTSDTYNTVDGQNSDALVASSLLNQLLSPGLPSNQWQIEARTWFETTLANVQHRTVDYVTNSWVSPSNGQLFVLPLSQWTDPDKPALQAQCSQQLIQGSAEYTSFSTLGLVITVTGSVLIILLSLVIPYCVLRTRKPSSSSKHHKYVAYAADAELQLLRMVLEHDNTVVWAGTGEDEIPFLPALIADHAFETPGENGAAIRYLPLAAQAQPQVMDVQAPPPGPPENMAPGPGPGPPPQQPGPGTYGGRHLQPQFNFDAAANATGAHGIRTQHQQEVGEVHTTPLPGPASVRGRPRDRLEVDDTRDGRLAFPSPSVGTLTPHRSTDGLIPLGRGDGGRQRG